MIEELKGNYLNPRFLENAKFEKNTLPLACLGLQKLEKWPSREVCLERLLKFLERDFYPLYRILKKNRSTIKANSYNFSDGFQKAYEKDRSSIKYLVDAAYSLEDSIRIEFFQLLEIQIVIKDLIKQENENDLFLLIDAGN